MKKILLSLTFLSCVLVFNPFVAKSQINSASFNLFNVTIADPTCHFLTDGVENLCSNSDVLSKLISKGNKWMNTGLAKGLMIRYEKNQVTNGSHLNEWNQSLHFAVEGFSGAVFQLNYFFVSVITFFHLLCFLSTEDDCSKACKVCYRYKFSIPTLDGLVLIYLEQTGLYTHDEGLGTEVGFWRTSKRDGFKYETLYQYTIINIIIIFNFLFAKKMFRMQI